MRAADLLLFALAISACKEPSPPSVDQSGAAASLRFKSGELLANHFADALSLEPRDFRTYAVAIGGVDAYDRTIYTPSEPSLSAPLIAERMALSACEQRAAIDFDQAKGEIFRGTRADIADTLYRRSMQRRATQQEIEILTSIQPKADLRSWTVLACVAVTTSMEALFY